MKMNKKLLRIASVFFVLLALIGCGIMTVFSNEVSHAKESGVKNTEAKGTFTFVADDTLKMITNGAGPSLMLGYTVTDSSHPSFDSRFRSEFNTKYRKNVSFGQAVSSSEILSVTIDDKLYKLYQLSDSSRRVFRSPTYVATAKNNLIPECSYTIELQTNNTLKLAIPSYDVHYNDLRRFNGAVFATNGINSSDFPDYVISDTPGTFYIHLFGAMNVSKGAFSNIFWSPLYHLGSIELE